MSSHGLEQLRGRVDESEALRGLLANAQSGHGQALVLRGEPGVGKTALLKYLTKQATGFRCVQVAGVESDMELAFAGLHQLCTPLLGHLDELPEPQRQALTVAFGRGVGPTPDRFLVGLAVLSLLAATGSTQPLLCVVDDAHWLDLVSVQTLSFIARRLVAEPVALVFAARDTGAEVLRGLPELTVGGLSDGDARELLDSVMPGRIDPRIRDRIVAETRGNPLALLEVPRTIPAADIAGGFWAMGSGPSLGQLQDSFVRRIKALPAETRLLVLTAAAEPVGDAALFLRAAAGLGIPVDALGPAEAAGVITFGPRMRFQHPLMRTAAYRAADLDDRRTVHRALAEATDPGTDPDRRAWHAANASAGPDDAVAADLEASAGRAQSRGGVAAAAALLERAATLTADPTRRGARALAAAQAKRDAAAPAAAYELLMIAELAPLSGLERARVARLRAQIEFVRSRTGEPGAPRVGKTAHGLLDAARRLADHDDLAARESYLEAIAAAMYAGRLGSPELLAAAAQAVQHALARTTEPPRPVDLLLRGWAARITGESTAGGAALRTGLEAMLQLARSDETQVRRWLVPAFPILQETAAHEVWDERFKDELSAAVVRESRRVGALASLPRALVYRAGVHLLAGEFSTATTLIAEAEAITAATDNRRPVRYYSLLLDAWRGVPEEALPLFASATGYAEARGEGRLMGMTGLAAAVLYNGLGRYEEALAVAKDVCAHEDFGIFGWCLLELVEAAAHTGASDVGAWAVQRLEERAGAAGTDWGLGALAWARALLAENADAEQHFTEAVDRLSRTRVVVLLARAHLAFGERLRRLNRRADARRELNAAHEMFTKMGAQAFADRARRELAATGEKVRKQPLSTGDELTAQEAQIARLAADGMTNTEIGAQLFISTHTVEWHLRKVFVKLGITSRRQLRTMSWAS